MFSSSLSKVSVPHLYPLRNLHLHHIHTPALDYHEQEALIFAQEDEQLDRLQTVYDSLYAISLVFDHEIIIPATSMMKLLTCRLLHKHWQNYVRTRAAQPARKTRSLAGHQKMPVVPLSRTSDGSFKLSWIRQKNLPPEARKAWTEIAPLSGQQSLEWGYNL